MDIIRTLFRITCASCISLLRASDSDPFWDLVFELGWSFCMVMGELSVYLLEGSIIMVLGATIGYTIVGSICILLGLELGNYFGTREVYFVGVSLYSLGGLMVSTFKGYIVGLSMGLPFLYPLVMVLGNTIGSKYPNTGAVLGFFYL